MGHRVWTIVELFYRSHFVFREQFESYEDTVLKYSRLTGTPRTELRLTSDELASLLDLKSMERLRDGYIHPLKDLCHLVFRGKDRTDLLDRYVSDIFHEISILKEQHYNVKTYGPLYEQDAAEVELRYLLDEAHNRFPEELNHIRYLFGQAQTRLEAHLGSFRNMELFVRSLYWHRDDFVANAYPDGIRQFYRLMYPLGAVEGFYRVGESFSHAGFFSEALEAFGAAEESYRAELAGLDRRDAAAGGVGAGGTNGAARRAEIADLLRRMRRQRSRLLDSVSRRRAEDEKVVSLRGLARSKGKRREHGA